MDIDASYYSIAEVASHLSLSIKTIRRHIASGDLEAAKIGSVYRIPKRAVEHFINGIKDNPKVAYDLFGEPICSTIETKRKNATKLTDNAN